MNFSKSLVKVPSQSDVCCLVGLRPAWPPAAGTAAPPASQDTRPLSDPGPVLMGGGTMTDAVFPWNSLKGTSGRCTTLLTLDSEPATPLDRGRPGSGSPPCPRSSGPPRRPAPRFPPAPGRPCFSDAGLESPWRRGRRASGRVAEARPGWARPGQARRAQARRTERRDRRQPRPPRPPTPGHRPLAAPPAHRGVSGKFRGAGAVGA